MDTTLEAEFAPNATTLKHALDLFGHLIADRDTKLGS